MERKDSGWFVELPSGIIKNPVMKEAAIDLNVNDCVYLKGDKVYPMFSGANKLYGIVAVNAAEGKLVLVASTDN